ncbi:MAG: LysR family transcriptional regulator [Bacillota bacterium]
MYKLKYKIWLDKDGKVFGEGPCFLLKGIEKHGSLTSAARELKMSYSQAYNLIKNIEEKLGFTLITSQTGGPGGGKSELTAEARLLLEKYTNFHQECQVQLEQIFQKHFGKD